MSVARFVILFLVIGTIATLTELILRVFFPIHLTGMIESYQYDPVLGTRLKPDFHLYSTTDYQQEVHTNKIGTVNFEQSFDEYQTLIFAVGDSYTQGVGVPADASYPFQLSLLLNVSDQTYLKRYAVANLGIAAFGLKQSILSLEEFSKTIGTPQVVLYLGSSNDLQDDMLFLQGYRHRHLVEGTPRWEPWVKPLQWMTHQTEIGKRSKLAWKEIRLVLGKSSDPSSEQQAISPAPVASKSVSQLLEPSLNELASICKTRNIKLVVSWSDLPGTEPDSYQWLKQWANDNQVVFADWHQLLQSVQKSIPNIPSQNSHSGRHHRSWVNQVIARSFAEAISTDNQEKPD